LGKNLERRPQLCVKRLREIIKYVSGYKPGRVVEAEGF
jgi:hypothetical protein